MLPLVVALMCLTSATSAMAQGSKTWMPEFNPEKHVYIDSRLENHSSRPLSLPSLPAEIEHAQRVHNLKIFVVATEQGSDASPGPTLAADKLDQLILKWRSNPNFPVDDYLIVMWVRYKDDPVRGSVAANGGNRLRAYGMSAQHFAASDGPLIPVLKQHMRERPEVALSTIITNVNSEVSAAIAAQKSALERDEALKELPGILLFWGSIIAGLLLTVWIGLRFYTARSSMKSRLNRFENELNDITEGLADLKGKHGKFLKAQTDWETRFKGDSLKKLRSGLTAYSELLAIAAGASKRLAEVRRAAGKYWFPRIQGSLDASRLLVEDDIVVSSREIELEMATLFGGLTIDKKVAPGDIKSSARALNATADSLLTEIEDKLALVETTSATVGSVVTWCRDQGASLEQEKLSLAPYEDDIAELEQELATFKRDAQHNPVALVLEAPTLSGLSTKLKTRVQRALTLAAELERDSKTLATHIRAIEQLRATEVEYLFPGASRKGSTRTYQLTEPGGDPDDTLHEVGGLLMQAFDKLAVGDQDGAHAAMEASWAKRAEATALVKTFFAAKEAVERDLHLVATTRDALTEELSAANTAIERLKSDFVAINFPDAGAQYDGSREIYDGAAAALNEVKAAYDKQHYLQSARLLAELLADIELARQDCTEVLDQLELLTHYREEARTLVSESRTLLGPLAPKLKEHGFTTSKEVDQRLAAASTEVAQLELIVPQAIADWVDAHTRATALKQELSDIDWACDQELALYEEAFALVGSLPADVESAFLTINAVTLQPARDAHNSAVSELEGLACDIDVPKSDWQRLKARAESAHALCQTCRNQAAANDAQRHGAAINLAYCKVRSRRFARRKHKHLTEANRLYALASAAFARRDWENAFKLANAAFKEFLKFDRQIKRRNATLVVKGAPGGGSSAPPSASGSQTSSDDGYSAGIAVAIGMSMGSGNPTPSTGSSASSSTTTTPSYTPSSTPSYSSDSGGSSFSGDSGGGSFSGGSGGGEY